MASFPLYEILGYVTSFYTVLKWKFEAVYNKMRGDKARLFIWKFVIWPNQHAPLENIDERETLSYYYWVAIGSDFLKDKKCLGS